FTEVCPRRSYEYYRSYCPSCTGHQQVPTITRLEIELMWGEVWDHVGPSAAQAAARDRPKEEVETCEQMLQMETQKSQRHTEHVGGVTHVSPLTEDLGHLDSVLTSNLQLFRANLLPMSVNY
ncbi:hypothetical protein L915_04327, partial [Phytophthora nicotianae]